MEEAAEIQATVLVIHLLAPLAFNENNDFIMKFIVDNFVLNLYTTVGCKLIKSIHCNTLLRSNQKAKVGNRFTFEA